MYTSWNEDTPVIKDKWGGSQYSRGSTVVWWSSLTWHTSCLCSVKIGQWFPFETVPLAQMTEIICSKNSRLFVVTHDYVYCIHTFGFVFPFPFCNDYYEMCYKGVIDIHVHWRIYVRKLYTELFCILK